MSTESTVSTAVATFARMTFATGVGVEDLAALAVLMLADGQPRSAGEVAHDVAVAVYPRYEVADALRLAGSYGVNQHRMEVAMRRVVATYQAEMTDVRKRVAGPEPVYTISDTGLCSARRATAALLAA
jgi:hypothetical protein